MSETPASGSPASGSRPGTGGTGGTGGNGGNGASTGSGGCAGGSRPSSEHWLPKMRLAVNALLSEPDEISDGLESELYVLRDRLDTVELAGHLEDAGENTQP